MPATVVYGDDLLVEVLPRLALVARERGVEAPFTEGDP